MNAVTPTPALVTQGAVQRLPRLALLLFCAAYVLPGIFGRDPWKNADLAAFGYMAAMAEGRTSWLAPTVGGLPLETALLPHWLGALAIRALPMLDAAIAARLPFALLLVATLVLVWYTTFHLARTEAAQPLPLAFGGEAHPIDYARALADGALLALIGSLGLLGLGHETTPELAQLGALALYLWSLAAAPFRGLRARLAVLAALPLLAACGAPSMALAVGLIGAVTCARSGYDAARRFVVWVAAATLLAAAVAQALDLWAWRAGFRPEAGQLVQLARLFAWFMWPAWLLALWTLWRWRHHLLHRHIAVPLGSVAVGLASTVVMGGSDRALLLALPGLAVLAAFALPTMRRGVTAAIDWFSVFFFSLCALFIWVYYAAMHLGVPAKALSNLTKLAPGFEPVFSGPALAVAAAATLAWIWLVRWRTGRHRPALWKSLVLPASGVALCWLLLMTLWLPLLDYARSYRPWVAGIARLVPAQACIAAPNLSRAAAAALERFGGWRVDAAAGAMQRDCGVLLLTGPAAAPPSAPASWQVLGTARRPTDREDVTVLFVR